MNFFQSDIDQAKELIQGQFNQGYAIIVYPGEQPILGINDLSFFNNSYDALEFCYENSTDYDHFRCGTSESVLQLLENQEQQNKIVNIKSENMNKENFDYLKNQVKFTGFGDSLENDLRANIEKQQPTFQLKHDHAFGKDETTSLLNFRKSDNNDMYFFNNYHLSLKQSGEKDPVEQTFYVGKDNTFTMKEAYNLLSGRAVNKDLVNREKEGYNAWVQLNFKETDTNCNYKLKHFTQNYGYSIEDALSKHPIKELANAEDKGKLVESLKKGNRQSATFLSEGNEQKRFIEANPQFKSITVYDGNMQRIRQDQKEGESKGQSASQDRKNNQKQKDDDGEGAPKSAQKKAKRRGQSVS